MDSLDAVIEAKIGAAFQGDTGRLVAQEIANAVRSYLESPEVVETVCAAGADFNGFAWPEDYDGHQREMIRTMTRTSLEAALCQT